MRRSWRWVLLLGGAVLVVTALRSWRSSRAASAPSAGPAAVKGCPPAARDSLEAELARLGGRSRAAGARGDLAALRVLSDSVDSLRRIFRRRCPVASSGMAP